MLNVNNLQYELHDELLFKPVNFTLASGECLQLNGINGVGKSTILKVLAGLLKARRGSLLWQGQKVSSLNKISCYLGHELGLNPHLTVQENLTFYARLHNIPENTIAIASNYFNLQGYLDKSVAHLSAGLKRRCQLTKLLLIKKPIWLLDESFASLDKTTIEKLLNLFQDFILQGGLIIFTSHQLINIPTVTIRNLVVEPYV